MRWGVVIPVLKEVDTLSACLTSLWSSAHNFDIVVADGGSTDGTPELARSLGVHVVEAPRGRARQMNAGAAACNADHLLFLHADTRLDNLPHLDPEAEAEAETGDIWGFHLVCFDSPLPRFRVLAWFMNRRSSMTRVATGDQTIYVARKLFEQVGGFADIALKPPT